MRVPISTYRLQITDDFTLGDALRTVPYLAALGVSDLYLSPIFEARSGSPHGYDVTDPTRIRASIGGIDALRALADEVKRHDMGIVLDIVPNHMAASFENPWWRDVLSRGQSSRYARFFDIDWGTDDAPRRLSLPILGDRPERLIERGELVIDENARELVYHDTRLPLTDTPFTAAADTPNAGVTAISALLDQQHYELVYWQDAATTINYRRFFDITDLAGLRVEDDDVFESSHSLIRELAADETITGLRVDHIDGLRDPLAYLSRLRTHVRGPDGGPVYTVVEKILEHDEELPPEWPCEGATGYEFLRLASGIMIEPDGHHRISALYHRVTGDRRVFADLAREKKLLVMDRLFGAELTSLSRALSQLTALDEERARRVIAELTASLRVYRTYADSDGMSEIDRDRIDEAVADAMRRNPDMAPSIATLRGVLIREPQREDAIDFVLRWQQFTGPVMAKGFEDTALYCHNVLLAANDVGTNPAEPSVSTTELCAALEARFARTPHAMNATATHDTKRGEDTRSRLAAISEVPDEWRTRFRRWAREGEAWKADLSEEDTEEPGADVDSLLYQTLIGAWPAGGADDVFLDRVRAYMSKAVREAKEQTSWRRPDADFEHNLDTYIEALMSDVGRDGLIQEIQAFADRIAPYGALNSIAQLLLRMTAPGLPDTYQGTELWSSTLVDPDNRRPVDYAERRRMLEELRPLLRTPEPASVVALLHDWSDGRIKLFLTATALRFRTRHRDLYARGQFVPMRVAGTRAAHVVAFARARAQHAAITVIPRWTVGLAAAGELPVGEDVWHDTVISVPPELRRSWYNALTGETLDDMTELAVARIFATVPFALLETSRPIGA